MASKKKSSRRISPTVFALHTGLFMLLLVYVNAVSSVSHEITTKSVLLCVGGIAAGAWISGQWIFRRSVEIVGLPVKGFLGVTLGALGALLFGVSVYTLLASSLR
jgi:hypothetical protein